MKSEPEPDLDSIPAIPERPTPSKQTEKLKRWLVAYKDGGPALRRYESQQEVIFKDFRFAMLVTMPARCHLDGQKRL